MTLAEALEVLEAAGQAILVLGAAVLAWSVLDRRSRAAAAARAVLARPGAGWGLLVVFGLAVFAVAAEDVVEGGPHEFLVWLNAWGRDAAHAAAGLPAVQAVARAASGATGPGLVVLVVGAGLGLGFARRWRDAAVVVAGTAGAWALSALLKLAFASSRPDLRVVKHAISGYGFPSAHALVTLVACGLLASTFAPRASARERRALGMAVAGIAVVSAASRVVLDAHWVSDVVAGLAVGAAWLGAVRLVVAPPALPGPGRPA